MKIDQNHQTYKLVIQTLKFYNEEIEYVSSIITKDKNEYYALPENRLMSYVNTP